MAPEDLIRVRRKNEHIKTAVSFINSASVGFVALGIIAPMMEPENPLFGYWGSGINEKVRALAEVGPSDVSWIPWIGALILQICAHALIRFIKLEE